MRYAITLSRLLCLNSAPQSYGGSFCCWWVVGEEIHTKSMQSSIVDFVIRTIGPALKFYICMYVPYELFEIRSCLKECNETEIYGRIYKIDMLKASGDFYKIPRLF